MLLLAQSLLKQRRYNPAAVQFASLIYLFTSPLTLEKGFIVFGFGFLIKSPEVKDAGFWEVQMPFARVRHRILQDLRRVAAQKPLNPENLNP